MFLALSVLTMMALLLRFLLIAIKDTINHKPRYGINYKLFEVGRKWRFVGDITIDTLIDKM